MTVALPQPMELPMPPGDVADLRELVRDVAGADFWLATLGDRLAGPAAAAPGWLGEDATAAAAQITRVATLVRAAAGVVRTAAGRLSAHADVLADARGQVRTLREEQADHFAEARARWAHVEDLRLQIMIGAPGVEAIVDDLHRGEASRQRRHAALLAEVTDDARATAAVLAQCCAVVGGRGMPGDDAAVIAYLAAELPGWGDVELRRRGRAAADAFISGRTSELEAAARAGLPYAGSAAFADALLAAMGPVWTRETLIELGSGSFGVDSPAAQMMALALGGAASGGRASAVAEVLAAEYVAPRDEDPRQDLVVLGMGTVLTASLALGARGLAPATVAGWARQIAAREHALGASAIDRVNPVVDEAAPVDALPVAVAILASGPDRLAAADFLDGPGVWDALLARSWVDCGISLHRLVSSAALVEGTAGESVVRGGLEALAAGLRDGDVSDWPVNRGAANAVAPALADGIAVHPSVVAEVLVAGAGGNVAAADGDLLRGLGYVTLNRPAAKVVEQALQLWVTGQTVPEWVEGPPPVIPAIVVPNAYLAVQNFGLQLAHSLHEQESKEEADDRAFLWNMTVGLATSLTPGPYGIAAGVVADYVAMWVGADGRWDAEPRPEDLRPAAPDPSALVHLTPAEWTVVDRMARQAETAFEGAGRVLGEPATPTSPVSHWWDPVLAAKVLGPEDLIGAVKPGSAVARPPHR